jgi:uncharacterized protein
MSSTQIQPVTTEKFMSQHIQILSAELGVPRSGITAAAALLDEGATVPFISRYRKEATGGLDETVITAIRDGMTRLRALDKRREAVIASLQERDLLTAELHGWKTYTCRTSPNAAPVHRWRGNADWNRWQTC